MAGRPAVFVDRDDTLNKDCPYCRTPDEIHLLPTVAEGVRAMNAAGLPVIVVTNQSGIARGYFTERDLAAVHRRLRDLLAAEGTDAGAGYAVRTPAETPSGEDDRDARAG
jgi:histidinol-phosphate phosphatase family protein